MHLYLYFAKVYMFLLATLPQIVYGKEMKLR